MIILTDAKGNEYQLEFNRKVVASMENSGFKMDLDYPNTMIENLFYGAFQMHHKNINRDLVRSIWKGQRRKDKLIEELVKLYQAPLEDLMAEPEGEDENPTWKTV